jgi:hypothetical protein
VYRPHMRGELSRRFVCSGARTSVENNTVFRCARGHPRGAERPKTCSCDRRYLSWALYSTEMCEKERPFDGIHRGPTGNRGTLGAMIMGISNKSARTKTHAAPPTRSRNHIKKSVASTRSRARRSDEGSAFLPDPYDGAGAKARVGDELAEVLAEDYVASATTAEEVMEDGEEEFAIEPDASNPIDANREPFPTATRLGNG